MVRVEHGIAQSGSESVEEGALQKATAEFGRPAFQNLAHQVFHYIMSGPLQMKSPVPEGLAVNFACPRSPVRQCTSSLLASLSEFKA